MTIGAGSRAAPLRCRIVRSDTAAQGKQGLNSFGRVSSKSVGARAKAHLYEQHETAIAVLSGEAEM